MRTLFQNQRLLPALLLVILYITTGCRAYKHAALSPSNTIDMVQFYVLDDKFPADFGWRVEIDVLRKTGLEGRIMRLTRDENKNVFKRRPQKAEDKKRLQYVVLYVKNSFAQALIDSNRIYLSFDQVTRSEVYEFNSDGSANRSYLAGLATFPFVAIIIGAVACSCPVVYADNPDQQVFEGDIFSGSTHPQLERNDWLPLSHLQADSGVYRIQIANEDPEIQYINSLELIAVDQPEGTIALYDKYGRLHVLAHPESPIAATDLDGLDVLPALLREGDDSYRGSVQSANPKAEDGLMLHFRRQPGARNAKLLIRANTSPWLAYSHKMLQNDLGKYGPGIRRKFLEKDSAALQQWTLEQNIPLSVWLETAPGKWERTDFFNLIGPKAPRRDVLPIDLSKVEGEAVHLKLSTGFRFWEIDYVALDYTSGSTASTRVLPLVSATDQNGRDLKDLLRADDGQYYVQAQTGDEARLRFSEPPAAADGTRTLLLHAKGYYQILHEPSSGSPSRRYLRQFTHPDAFPKYARDRWNDFFNREILWTAQEH